MAKCNHLTPLPCKGLKQADNDGIVDYVTFVINKARTEIDDHNHVHQFNPFSPAFF